MNRIRVFSVLAFVLCLGTLSFSFGLPVKAGFGETPESGDFRWQLNGPFGGTVRSLAQDPQQLSRFFLGTNDGQLYVSTDGAQSWTWISSLSRPGCIIDNLVIDPRDHNLVYLSMWALSNERDGGVFKSMDSGKTWKNIFTGHSIRALTMADQDSKLLIAGALDGVFRSTDAGKSWNLISPPNHPELRNVESIAIDPRNTQCIYAGTWHLPWKTEDGGKNWFSTKGDVTQIIDDSDIFSICIDRATPDRVFSSACSGIYRSTDAGKNWTKFKGIPYTSRRTHQIFQHPSRPNTIFACTTEGLWRTVDGGETWKLLTPKQTVINAIEIHESQPDRVVIGTEHSGILMSENLGETFQPGNLGFVTRQISGLVPDPTQRGRLLASVLYNGPEGGVYGSTDNGRTWQPSSQGLGSRDVYAIYANPANSKQYFAATSNGVFSSENSGASWTRLEMASKAVPKSTPKKTGVKTAQISSKSKVSPKPVGTPSGKSQNLDGHVMEVAMIEDGRSGLLAASWDGLFRTYDARKGWEKVAITGYNGRVFAVATTPREPDVFYIGTTEGLFVSRDKGATWTRIEIDRRDQTFVQEIAVNPQNPKMVLVGTRRSLYCSHDGAKTWERLGHGVPYGDMAAVRFNPRNGDEILVGEAQEGGFYLSTDGGDHFRRIDRADLPSHRVWSVAFDLFEERQLYIGSFSSGVLVGSPYRAGITGQP